MLPLSLLRTAVGFGVLVELKNGETFNGRLIGCDSWMNIKLRDVYRTAADGDRFWRLPECYIRGNTIKYLRIPNEVFDKVPAERKPSYEARPSRGGGSRGGRGGERGGGRGGARGGRGGDRGRGGRGGDRQGRGGRTDRGRGGGERGRGGGERGRGGEGRGGGARGRS